MADDIDQSIRELVQLQNTYNTTLHAIQILIKEIENLREVVGMSNLSSTFQPPEEGWSVQQLKRDKCGDKDENDSPNNENEALQLEDDWEETVGWTPLAKTLYIAKQIEAHPEMEGVVWESLSEKLSSLRLDLTNLRSEEQQ